MRDEPTIPGNPRKFTRKQHFLSACLVSQFYGFDNKVDSYVKEKSKSKRKGGRERLFFGKRVWDQCTEKDYMGRIEKDFQEVIENKSGFNSRNHIAITKYFLLWKFRREAVFSSDIDITFHGIRGDEIEQEAEEKIESKGMAFCRTGGVMPSRFSGGIFIRSNVEACLNVMSSLRWGLLEAMDGEFLVADSYDDFLFLPIAPNLAFKAGVVDKLVDRNELIEFNKRSEFESKVFYFSRDLSMCPVC